MNSELSFTDLIFKVDELEIELEGLKKEYSSKCNDYKTLRKELCENREEAGLILEEKDKKIAEQKCLVESLQEELKFLRSQKEDLLNENQGLRNDLRSVDDKNENIRNLESSVQAMMEDIVCLTKKLDEKDEEIKLKDDKIQQVQASSKEITEAYQQLKEYHRKQEISFNDSYADSSMESSRKLSFMNNCDKMESLADSLLPSYQREVEELKNIVSELETSKMTIGKELEDIKILLDDKTKQFDSLFTEFEAKENVLKKTLKLSSEYEHKAVCFESKYKEERDNFEKAIQRCFCLEQKLLDINSECKEYQKKYEDILKQLEDVKVVLSELETLKGIVDKELEDKRMTLSKKNAQLESLYTELESKDNILKDSFNAIAKFKNDACNYKNKYHEEKIKLEKSHQTCSDLEEKLQKITSQHNDCENKCKKLLSQLGELENIVSEFEKNNQIKDNQLKSHADKILVLEKLLLEKESSLNELIVEQERIQMESKENLNIYRDEIDNLSKQKADLSHKYEQNKKGFEVKYSELVKQNDSFKMSLIKKQEETLMVRKVLKNLKEELQKKKDKLILHKQFIKTFQTEFNAIINDSNQKFEANRKLLAEKNSNISRLETNNRKLNSIIEKFEDEKKYMKHEIEELKCMINRKDNEMERMSMLESGNLENFKSQEYGLKLRIETLENEVQQLLKKSEEIGKNENVLFEKVQKYRNYTGLLTEKIEEQRRELDQYETDLINSNEKFLYLQKDYDFLKINLEIQQKDLEKSTKEIEKLTSENVELKANLLKLVKKQINKQANEQSVDSSESEYFSANSSSNYSQSNSSMIPPPLPPRREVPVPPSKLPSRNVYETIFNSKSSSHSGFNSETNSHKNHNSNFDPNNDPISLASSDSQPGPSSSNKQSNFSQNEKINPSFKINKHFSIADEEGQYMEGSSLLSEENERIIELNRRNTMLPPHLRASYAPEFQDRGLSEPRRQTILTAPTEIDFHNLTKNCRKVFETKNNISSKSSVNPSVCSDKTDLKRRFDQLPNDTDCPSVSQIMSPKLKQRRGFKATYKKLTPSKILGRKLDNKIRGLIDLNKENDKDK